jgi:hypothetical protein
MDAEEREICDFLKSYQNEYVASKEIAKRAGGKWRFREDPNWAVPVLMRLLDKKLVETDGYGHFRLPHAREKKEKKQWISPQLKKLLDEKAKEFEGVISIEEEPEQGTE